MTTKSKKSRRHQKLTLGRTRVSRRARRIRRTYMNVAMELAFALDSGDAQQIERAKARAAAVESQLKSLPIRARTLEVPVSAAAAELNARLNGEESDDE